VQAVTSSDAVADGSAAGPTSAAGRAVAISAAQTQASGSATHKPAAQARRQAGVVRPATTSVTAPMAVMTSPAAPTGIPSVARLQPSRQLLAEP
jgi:hypothetical protein